MGCLMLEELGKKLRESEDLSNALLCICVSALTLFIAIQQRPHSLLVIQISTSLSSRLRYTIKEEAQISVNKN